MHLSRIIDILFCSVLIVIFSLPMVLISLLSLLTSKGPILYWSLRKGIDNTNFKMPKFRSMHVGSPLASTDGIDYKSYLTPIGGFIRKYSLDELPQLFSILKGDMTLVGPRPALHTQYNLILFRKNFGICKIKPGLTGLAQTSGRNSMTIEDKVYFDLKYLRSKSILYDFQILLKTVFVFLIPGENEPVSASWPCFTQEEVNAVKKVILSRKLNDVIGSKNKEFEDKFCRVFGVKYSSTISSGTSALEIALRALDIGMGDEVIVSPRSFVASASSVVIVGARPVFVDIEYDSGNISADAISRHITSKTKAIICVHLGGNPCDMDSIMKLARANKISVIEDCAQAPGAKYKGKSVGSIGDLGAWSFCNDKIISTGEGGMITTNRKALIKKVDAFKNHGRQKKLPNISNKFSWECSSFGSNNRMTEMQAAIGLIQLKKLKVRHQIRDKYAKIILKAFKKNYSIFRVPKLKKDCVNAWYRIYVYLRPENLNSKWTREKIIEDIKTEFVNVNLGSCPEIYQESCFQNSKFSQKTILPNAKNIGETSISVSINPNIPIERINQFVEAIMRVSKKAKKSNELI